MVQPDSVPAIAEALQLDHTCYDCMSAPVNIPWHNLGLAAPDRLQLDFSLDSTGIYRGTIGSHGVMPSPNVLVFRGALRGDTIDGEWVQRLHDQVATGGHFRLIRRFTPPKGP
jgi:hypothetical protein